MCFIRKCHPQTTGYLQIRKCHSPTTGYLKFTIDGKYSNYHIHLKVKKNIQIWIATNFINNRCCRQLIIYNYWLTAHFKTWLPLPVFEIFSEQAVPAFPGATNTCLTWSDCASFQASVCSLPPLPTTSTRAVIAVCKAGI